MPLTSPRFAKVKQCQDAALNSPPLRSGIRGDGVAVVQQALIDLGYSLTLSVRRFGVPDGIFGAETKTRLQNFQTKEKLSPDGVAGHDTMTKLDVLLPLPHSAKTGLPYSVPGIRDVIAQPTSMICWATVHCMMRAWKVQRSMGIRQAAAAVDEKYGVMVDNNQGMPPTEFAPFITAAGMAYEPMANLTIAAWVNLLRSKGLLWVGTLNSIGPGAGLHSRIVEAMSGDGSVDGTMIHIIDPDGGRTYQEVFRVFLEKYERAFVQAASDYYQIRHFI